MFDFIELLFMNIFPNSNVVCKLNFIKLKTFEKQYINYI